MPVTPSLFVSLAWRNLWRHRRRTLITLSSISLGFAIAVFFIGLGDGAHNSMIRNAIQLGHGHISVQPVGYQVAPANEKTLTNVSGLVQQVAGVPGVTSVEPRVELQVLVSTAHNSVGAGLSGFPVDRSVKAHMVEPHLVAGEWLESGDARGVLVGQRMAEKLKVRVGSKLVVMAGGADGEHQAQLARVRGIFETGMGELDAYAVISDLAMARTLLVGDSSQESATLLAIFLDSPEQLTELQNSLVATLQGLDQRVDMDVLTWQQSMPELVQFIALDDAGNTVFLIFILLMVVFGIANTMLMSVLERTREFGLLRALGMERRQLLLLVFCEVCLLGLVAVLLGWVLGGCLHLWFAERGLDMVALMGEESTALAGTVMDSVVYTELSMARVLELTLTVFSVTLITGIYPALKVVNVPPIAAIQS